MSIYLEILEGFGTQIDDSALRLAAETVLKHQNVPASAELSLIFSDDEHLQQLNLQFREIDAPTDVLSFPSTLTDPESGTIYLGDVIISVQKALAQAKSGGHTIMDELQLLTVHGVLHLLGHDHANEEQKSRMWAAQNEILNRLGLGQLPIPE